MWPMGLDLAFAIGIADAAREPDHAVVREDVAIERIERRLVDVGGEDALFQVVEVLCPASICARARIGGCQTRARDSAGAHNGSERGEPLEEGVVIAPHWRSAG